MSSIAYITDQQMIEYHRLHGHSTIVFWRPASKKKFGDFHYGDFLFFLAKGTEKGEEREKGIIGYGKFTKDDTRSVHDVWKKYCTLTGYGDESSFIDAVKKMNKSHELPQQMHCLFLEHVSFFQAPVYLSEVDKKISKQIESYIYLDQENIDTSWRILRKALQVGTDMWATLVEQHPYDIEQDADIILIQNLYEQLYISDYTEHERRRLRHLMKQYKKTATGDHFASGCDDFYLLEHHAIHIYIPCVTSLKTWKKQLMLGISRAILYQCTLEGKNSNSKVSILLDQEHKHAITLCDLAQVPYVITHSK